MLKHEGVENFNWNYVDQHILGYQDFAELPEVSKISSIGIFKFKLLSSIVFAVSEVSVPLFAVADRANVGRWARLTACHWICKAT